MFKKRKIKMEEKRKEAEKAELGRRLKEKALINRTLRGLKNTVDKYEMQKETLIRLAREAERRGLAPQYSMAANGLKIVIESQDKANAMYLNLTISNQIKEMCNDTKAFVDSMSAIAKQLSEIQSTIDFTQAQYDYECAMTNITQTEERLRDFSDNIYDSLASYADGTDSGGKVDEAIKALIRGASSDIHLPDSENNEDIDKKIKELEGMLNGCK